MLLIVAKIAAVDGDRHYYAPVQRGCLSRTACIFWDDCSFSKSVMAFWRSTPTFSQADLVISKADFPLDILKSTGLLGGIISSMLPAPRHILRHDSFIARIYAVLLIFSTHQIKYGGEESAWPDCGVFIVYHDRLLHMVPILLKMFFDFTRF